jgi:hypothetical protein
MSSNAFNSCACSVQAHVLPWLPELLVHFAVPGLLPLRATPELIVLRQCLVFLALLLSFDLLVPLLCPELPRLFQPLYCLETLSSHENVPAHVPVSEPPGFLEALFSRGHLPVPVHMSVPVPELLPLSVPVPELLSFCACA